MCVALVGGMDRLHREYVDAAARLGVTLKVFHGRERSIEKQIGSADALILCAGKVSHSARREAIKHADSKNIPVWTMRQAGVCSLRCCLKDCCCLADSRQQQPKPQLGKCAADCVCKKCGG